jgi:hypothetical protein
MALSTNSNAIFGVGDIVYDPTAVLQAIEQVKQLKDQVTLAQDTLVASTGIKDAVNLYEDLKQLTSIMDEYKVTLADLDIENPKSKIGQMAQQIFKRNQVFDNCNVDYLSPLQKETCKNKQVRNVSDIASSIIYSQELEKTSKRLQTLSTKLTNSADLKTSQDIGNAISLELAQLEMSKANVEMMEKANIAKYKADQDRLKQEKSKTLGALSDKSSWFK